MWGRAWKDFFNLLFPDCCVGCERSLVQGEVVICLYCRFLLPYTNFHHHPSNDSAKQLWGRVYLSGLTSFLFFRDKSKVERMIYHLKYRGKKDIAYQLGLEYGRILMISGWNAPIDVLVPVPLHRKKHKKRGYNQSAIFAQGLSAELQVPVDELVLKRVIDQGSQTNRNRIDRSVFLEEALQLGSFAGLEGKHIVLVDDVLTTGATLEACATELLKIPGIKVSAITLARKQ